MIVGVKQRHENTTPYKRDANVVPEEQNANNNQEIYKNSESDLQEPLSIDNKMRLWASLKKVFFKDMK